MKKLKVIVPVAIAVAAVVFIVSYAATQSVPVLEPAGDISRQERDLLFFGLLLAVIVVVPTFGLAIFIALKYREDNNKPRKYQPDWDHSRLFESIWWGIPIVIIGILCVVTWRSSHSLDPYKPLASTKPALNVQVVSLNWKWLFIYPEQHVASVNQLAIPTDRPISLHLTSDTVMNSFWVPSLSGQIYNMPGMITRLHLVANKPGDYFGSPANITGKGFSRMNFTVKALPAADFADWVGQAQQSNRNLTEQSYAALAKPSSDVPVSYYSPIQDGLFEQIVGKYMHGGMPSMQPESSKTGYPQLQLDQVPQLRSEASTDDSSGMTPKVKLPHGTMEMDHGAMQMEAAR